MIITDLPHVLNQTVTDDYAVYNADCVEVLRALPESSVHYSIFSPPFASLYTYSASDRDMGNVRDAEEFAEHFAYLIPELLRVTKPGRLLSFHCMLLPTSKQRDGFIGIDDFRGALIRAFVGNDGAQLASAITALKVRAFTANMRGDAQRFAQLEAIIAKLHEELQAHPGEQGWIFHSEVVIWKDPVTAMQRTKALGLLHKQIKKDSCMSRQGIPDYLVTMRKPGDNPERVTHTDDSFPVSLWQRYASPVWFDINPSKTLQKGSAREDEDERHICPLQLEVIERALELWTNPGDVVLSPFTGIGSEGYCALRAGRRFVGAELKESYYRQAVANLRDAGKQLGLFAMGGVT